MHKYLVYLAYVVLLLNPDHWLRVAPWAAYPMFAFGLGYTGWCVFWQGWVRDHHYKAYMSERDARFWEVWRNRH